MKKPLKLTHQHPRKVRLCLCLLPFHHQAARLLGLLSPSRVILIFIFLLSPGPLTLGWGGSTGFVSSQAPPLPTPQAPGCRLGPGMAPSSPWSALSDLAFAWISGPTAFLPLSTWSCFSCGGALAKGLSPAPELIHLYASVNLKGNDNQLLLIPFY